MSEIVFKVIAFGFQGIVVFVLDFPARSSDLSNQSWIGRGDEMIGDKGIVIQDLACFFIRDDQFQPIDRQRILAIA